MNFNLNEFNTLISNSKISIHICILFIIILKKIKKLCAIYLKLSFKERDLKKRKKNTHVFFPEFPLLNRKRKIAINTGIS